jgi:hypothetical protein
VFRPDVLQKQWDLHTDEISATIPLEPWREQRQQLAYLMAKTATGCLKARANEETWRAKIEPFIAGRFKIAVAWYVPGFKWKITTDLSK